MNDLLSAKAEYYCNYFVCVIFSATSIPEALDHPYARAVKQMMRKRENRHCQILYLRARPLTQWRCSAAALARLWVSTGWWQTCWDYSPEPSAALILLAVKSRSLRCARGDKHLNRWNILFGKEISWLLPFNSIMTPVPNAAGSNSWG